MIFISFIPLVLGFIVIAGSEDVISGFLSVFLSGELYFYAMSLCASIYITAQETTHKGNLGMRLWSGLFVICCGCFMALFIGQASLDQKYSPNFHGIASVLFLLGAIFINYRVMVLADQPPPMPEEVHRKRAEEMTKSVDPDYDQ